MKIPQWMHSIRFLILCALSICVIPMIGLMLHLHSLSLAALQESMASSAASETTFYAQLLDEEISQIRLQQYGLVNDDSVKRLNVMYTLVNKSEQSSMVEYTYASILARSSLSNMVQSNALYLTRQMKKISSINYLTDLSEEELLALRTIITENPSGIHIDSNGITLVAGYPIRPMQVYEHASILCSTYLSKNLIDRRINDLSQLSESSAFVLVADNTPYFYAHGYESIAQLAISGYKEQKDDVDYLLIGSEENSQIVTVAPIGNTGLQLMQITPQSDAFALLLQYKRQMPKLISLMALAILALSMMLYKIIYGPISASQAAFQRMETGDFNFQLRSTWTLEFRILFDQFNRMAQALQTHMQKEKEMQALTAESEIKQLQYQISPHFLYNSYFIMRGMLVQQDYDQAEELASLLGQYLKYIVHVESPYTQLKDEIMHARAYANIQQIRFGYRVSVQFDVCPSSMENLQVPRLIIQPLIENAFVHGVKNIVKDGMVIVHFAEQNDSMEIIVEDNGNDLSDTKLEMLQSMLQNASSSIYTSGIAIVNINRRLLLTYGETCGLRIDRSPLGGMRCTIHISQKEIQHYV